MITPQHIPKIIHRTPDVIFQEVGDESVLVRLTDEIYYPLKPVGDRVWRLLAQPRSIDELAQTLQSRYVISKEKLTTELNALIADLRAAGLVGFTFGSGNHLESKVA